MQTIIKTSTTVPLCKPGSAFALLKVSQASACFPTSASAMLAASANRHFSGYNNKQRSPRYRTLTKRNSRSPGRNSSPEAHNVPHRHSYQSQVVPFMVAHEVEETQASSEPASNSVFSHDSTLTLCKKLMIYKMMGSNVFINYSLTGISAAYKVLGTRITNFAIENTAASVFTGGVTVADLSNSAIELEQRGIGTIGCYVVEGVRDAQNEKLD